MRLGGRGRPTSEVFGISHEVRPDSYVDRGHLDELVGTALTRATHVALRGESKCGKSRLRQRILPDAVVVQCRLGKTSTDIYRDALSELDIRLEVEQTRGAGFTGRVEARGDLGLKLLARLGATSGLERRSDRARTTKPVGRDISDLGFIADILRASGRRLVIEDFHYLSLVERRNLAFDLKSLWDYGVFVVIAGVWSEQNMLLYLNPDLTGRVMEVPIVWRESDMREIFVRGGEALKLTFSDSLQAAAVSDCYQNVGILQTLILSMLDQLGLTTEQDEPVLVEDVDALQTVAMEYAEQLNPLYQQFAQRVSQGIRRRR
jgi:hypothetical protein